MKHWCLSLILILGSVLIGHGQTSDELKRKQQKLRDEIEYKEKLLKQIEADSKSSSTKVVLINKKINQREELISSIREEIVYLDDKIAVNEDLIEAFEVDIARLKEEYTRMVVQAYKTRNSSQKLMFIFASDDFGQAYRRLKYLQQLSEYRQRQAEAILAAQRSLESKHLALEGQRKEKNEVLNAQNKEKLTLNREKQEKEKELKVLSTKEVQYKKDLSAAEKSASELRLAIKKAIEREIAAHNEAAGTTGSTYQLTPEARELGNNFVANKGKLPWPVDKGEIVAKFGEQAHPFLKGIVVKKDGLTISTTGNSRARAVYDGEVSRIIILPGAGKVVMIRHGEYISIYTNLKETFVNTGDKVKTKEEIGIILTDKGKTEIEFQLWKSTDLQDPSYWLYQAR
ncbi:MAG: peptidoglycan DD-metalloendopeptidase family protein [Flavobacteriales bacterium]|nr:peptidoglycan DD-metalloendopeptidase family protein [Flavobacteriales bacterium]